MPNKTDPESDWIDALYQETDEVVPSELDAKIKAAARAAEQPWYQTRSRLAAVGSAAVVALGLLIIMVSPPDERAPTIQSADEQIMRERSMEPETAPAPATAPAISTLPLKDSPANAPKRAQKQAIAPSSYAAGAVSADLEERLERSDMRITQGMACFDLTDTLDDQKALKINGETLQKTEDEAGIHYWRCEQGLWVEVEAPVQQAPQVQHESAQQQPDP